MCMKKRFFLGLLFVVYSTVFAQIDVDITKRYQHNLTEIGKLKNLTSKEIKSSKLGIGFETLDRKVFEPSKFYDKVGAIGVKWARCQTGWARTETKKGKYDFKWLDDVVDNLLARGIQPWFNVGYGNPLYMSPVTNPTAVGHIPLYYGDECFQAWKNYVRALAKHFKGRVKHFEIWNEPELKEFWQPKDANPFEYAKLIEVTAKEIKLGNPEAMIGACSCSSFRKATHALFSTDAVKLLDFFSVHAYCMMPELNFPNGVKALRALIEKKGIKCQIWQGETGFPSYIPSTSWVAKAHAYHSSSEDMQAKGMLRRYITDLTAGIDMTSFFMVTDFTSSYLKGTGNGMNEEAVWGIIENEKGNYRPKKVYYVMRNFCTMFDNRTKLDAHYFVLNLEKIFPRKLQTSKLGWIASSFALSSFTRNDTPIYCYYLPEDPQMEMKTVENITLINYASKSFKNPILIDMMTGKVYKVNRQRVDKLGQNIDGLPLTDYPLFVTDLKAIEDIFEAR